MAKQQKTARELEEMVHERIGQLRIAHLEVRPDPAFGWAVFVVAPSQLVGRYQAIVDDIARELRAKYDLKE